MQDKELTCYKWAAWSNTFQTKDVVINGSSSWLQRYRLFKFDFLCRRQYMPLDGNNFPENHDGPSGARELRTVKSTIKARLMPADEEV